MTKPKINTYTLSGADSNTGDPLIQATFHADGMFLTYQEGHQGLQMHLSREQTRALARAMAKQAREDEHREHIDRFREMLREREIPIDREVITADDCPAFWFRFGKARLLQVRVEIEDNGSSVLSYPYDDQPEHLEYEDMDKLVNHIADLHKRLG